MLRRMLKSKIHKATITGVNLHYQGSMCLDPVLARAAKILPFERIDVYNLSNGERFSTYAIYGQEEGNGEIQINGAAAWKAHKGDLVIVASYADYTDAELREYEPRLIYVDNNNKILDTANDITDPRMPYDDRLIFPRG